MTRKCHKLSTVCILINIDIEKSKSSFTNCKVNFIFTSSRGEDVKSFLPQEAKIIKQALKHTVNLCLIKDATIHVIMVFTLSENHLRPAYILGHLHQTGSDCMCQCSGVCLAL